MFSLLIITLILIVSLVVYARLKKHNVIDYTLDNRFFKFSIKMTNKGGDKKC